IAGHMLGVFLILLLLLELALGANILGVFPYRIQSPFQMVRPLMKALTERGHNVTMITPQGMLVDIEGVRHIRVPMLNQHIEDMDTERFRKFFSGKWPEVALTSEVFGNMSFDVLNDDGVQSMLRNREESFDMVMLEANRLDALFGFAEFYNATLVGLASVRTNWVIDNLAGNSAPSVYEPSSPMGFDRGDSIRSKLQNWIYITEEKLLEHLVFQPTQERIFRQFFGYSAQKMKELRSKFSVILINTHFSIGRVRANVPNIIEVGGIHLSEPMEPCDEDLQRFLDEAEHGVIFFSIGLDLLIRHLPDTVQQPLMQSFAQLKERVVWKSDLSSMPNQSENVYLISKAPQRKVLEHPNIRLFITHGGLLSIMEGIYSGVPMLGLPVFFDHFENLHRLKLSGMAEVLDSESLSTDSVTSTIRELIGNPKYKRNAREMSLRFRDRPISPLDTAVWWTEYVLRHRNTEHMRLNEDEIPLIWYYRLDNLISFGLRFGLIGLSVIFLIWRLIQKFRDRRKILEERPPVVL
ncbi:hypothetical protein KR009_009258, partial [Drosophila setifemur]